MEFRSAGKILQAEGGPSRRMSCTSREPTSDLSRQFQNDNTEWSMLRTLLKRRHESSTDLVI